MAKKNPYLGMKADIKASAIAMRADRMGEFKWTQSALQGVYKNLGTTLGGGRAGMTGEQARLLGKLASLKQNQGTRSRAIAGNAKANVASLYGSATAGSLGTALGSVKAAGKAGRQTVGGQVAAGGILARGDQAAYTTLEQGVQMAKAGAKGQLADALAYRAKNDASLIAQRQLAMDQMRLQNQLDIQNYKKKLALQSGTAGNAAASALANVASDTVPSLIGYFNDKSLANGGEGITKDGHNYVTPAEAANAWAAANGITDPNDPQYKVVLAVAQSIRSSNDANGGNYDPADISSAVQQQLAIMYPDLKPGQLSSLGGIVTAASSNWNLAQASSTVAVDPTVLLDQQNPGVPNGTKRDYNGQSYTKTQNGWFPSSGGNAGWGTG